MPALLTPLSLTRAPLPDTQPGPATKQEDLAPPPTSSRSKLKPKRLPSSSSGASWI